jgi:hypothetical protein
LKTNVKRGYNGNFGISAKRFMEDGNLQDVPGPGTYDEPEEVLKAKKATSVFASKSNRMELANPTSNALLSIVFDAD